MSRFLSRKQAETRLARGDLLRMAYGERGARLWWFDAPFAAVSDDIAHAITMGFGRTARVLDSDSLFGTPFTGQTWAAIRGSA